MQAFSEVTRRWFASAFSAPSAIQAQGWATIASGQHALLVAPTGSGKTLAAFLWSIDRSMRSEAAHDRVRVLYVSPLKALVYDIDRNLRGPLAGLAQVAADLGVDVRLPRVAVRTGDTSAHERRQQARNPSDILVTTPESLYLLLTSEARRTLRDVDTIIIDEVHALAPTKRGAHLALSLERLSALTAHEPQRVGLSATAQPREEVARYLGGDRPVAIVDVSAKPALDIRVDMPSTDLSQPDQPGGLWPALHPELLALVQAHTSTILFVNSRGLCERLCQQLNDLAGRPLLRAHHGSLSHEERRGVETQLKDGEIAGIVATSSLELGIDMASVDLVVLIESPGSVARGLQRIGRAGHAVGEVSKGRLFPKHRGDLLEATVVAERMQQGALEALRLPRNPLDVLAQQIVAMVAMDAWQVDALEQTLRRAASYQTLPRSAFIRVLDMLSGHFPSHAFAELHPRIVWDRRTDTLSARRGAKLVAIINGGTIPDRGSYPVHMGKHGPRIGELDEEMVHETLPGQVFTLGASSWRVDHVTRDRVVVSPAPGEPGKLPFWRGEGPGRPLELGRAIGAFLRDLETRPDTEAAAWLMERYPLEPPAARQLLAYVRDQQQATGSLPTDGTIVLERFRDELGDWRVCLLSPFGAQVHAPWAMAIEAGLAAETGFDVQSLWTDDGILLRFAGSDDLPDLATFLPDPEQVESRVMQQLGHTPLFAGMFRENAARALLLPRRHAGSRTPLWLQRRRAAALLAVTRQYPDFPLLMETYRACLQDLFDVATLVDLLQRIRGGEVRVVTADTPTPSPFARSLVLAFMGANLYASDTPLAERRAQALTLDPTLLRELLGPTALQELLDPTIIERVEAELQALSPERRAADADSLHDVLRRVGDLSNEEVAARCRPDQSPALLLQTLAQTGRAIELSIGGALRWVAMEDAARYRDALGSALPVEVPAALRVPVADAIARLVGRFASSRGPFYAKQLAQRYALPTAQVEPWLREAAARGQLTAGPKAHAWCDVEVLRRIKQRSLWAARREVEPVDAQVLGRFLPAWHGVGERVSGQARLEAILVQLEGLPLSFRELEQSILPSRMQGFVPRMLDELGASGWLVWVGMGQLGARDGRIAIFRRTQVAGLLDPTAVEATADPLQGKLLDHLAQQGASFFAALLQAAAPAGAQEVLGALQQLVWAGVVTNDTFQPLRALAGHLGSGERSRRQGFAKATGGRWSLVMSLVAPAPTSTEQAHARAQKLLERHGVVAREVMPIEAWVGGFGSVYRVLRAMEEAGRVRRGYFVAALTGAQFALPGAVDRLRTLRTASPARAYVLSAVDPANPFGWVLPWPERADTEGNAVATLSARRIPGAKVMLVDGTPVLYLAKGAKRLLSFPAAEDPETLARALGLLRQVAAESRSRTLRIREIDGLPARTATLAPALRAAGFVEGYAELELDVAR